MDAVTLGLIVLAGTFGLLMLRVPIAFALGVASSVGIVVHFIVIQDMSPGEALRPALAIVGTTPYGFINSYTLATIPLFVFMGHVAYEAGFTTDIYRAARLWMARIPGGLAMASVAGCGGFSAITGSSVACAAAMGRIAIPEMRNAGYSPALSTGSVAAGGTLGSLIPPSILFILYGIFTEQSIEKLFIAGIIPGLLSLLGYMTVIVIWARLRPGAAPTPDETITLNMKLMSLARCWAILIIFCVVIGGIYVGVFTPSESAGVGAFATLALGFGLGRLTLKGLFSALKESAFQTSMIFAIAIGGKLFTAYMSLTSIPDAVEMFIKANELSFALVMVVLILFYLLLGMFLDPIGILILTLPITVPIIESYQLGPLALIWFGVIVVKMLEIGLITPPIGLNVFVIKSVAGRTIALETIFKGIAAFLISDAVVVFLLVTFPVLSLALL